MASATAIRKKDQPRRTPASGVAKRTLERAFQTFTTAAGSLEKSYGQLHAEVERLRCELERSNQDLATSLEENAEMRRYLSRVLESLPCGVIVANRRGEVRMTNSVAAQLLEAAIRPSPSSCFTDGDSRLPAPIREFLDSVHAGTTPRETECQWRTAEGLRTMSLACAVMSEGENENAQRASVFILRDVTEEKRQAAERETVRRRESLAELATLLAHEIRNPLGSLELFAGLLADAAAEQPDLRRWTDHVQAGLRSLSATVNNVLQFHSEPKPRLTAVNLGQLMRESVEFLRPLARQGGLRIDLQNGLGELEIALDAHRLQQVFFNLALNAFRAMSVGGTLTVRLEWEDHDRFSEVRIEFQDTGRGIAPEHQERIFEPGFTTHAGNPGIGLAVCRTVIAQHAGKFSVASEPGRGSTFAIVLPRAGGIQ
jgi:signal transduction histidine kinase